MMVRKSGLNQLVFIRSLSQDWHIWLEAAYSNCLHIINEPLIALGTCDQISNTSINRQLTCTLRFKKWSQEIFRFRY